ncbi:hypothetical protein BDV93DRAFT_216697 [Ceratobasidium sp. AG-I]|nr:hypothetical protein BDV93DRAFT_216697 [Ceratobasidium sp. AG-I]
MKRDGIYEETVPPIRHLRERVQTLRALKREDDLGLCCVSRRWRDGRGKGMRGGSKQLRDEWLACEHWDRAGWGCLIGGSR